MAMEAAALAVDYRMAAQRHSDRGESSRTVEMGGAYRCHPPRTAPPSPWRHRRTTGCPGSSETGNPHLHLRLPRPHDLAMLVPDRPPLHSCSHRYYGTLLRGHQERGVETVALIRPVRRRGLHPQYHSPSLLCPCQKATFLRRKNPHKGKVNRRSILVAGRGRIHCGIMGFGYCYSPPPLVYFR